VRENARKKTALFYHYETLSLNRVPQNIVWGSETNSRINKELFGNKAKNYNYTSKYGDNFCPAIGKIWVKTQCANNRLFIIFYRFKSRGSPDCKQLF
jgi:hypothetical protein